MISRLLVANRGEIACRIMRTAAALGIQTVAVYADPDADALHVERADLAVPLEGVTAAETYLVGDKLVEAADRAGADAVHPGYGFLAEHAAFARAVVDAGLCWVGPPPDAIAAMGDKLAAKTVMADAGVPVLGSATDPEEVARIGYPLIVKAAAGGGGKGMRVVTRPEDLEDALAAARRESARAFGDDRVFAERYLPRPRHIEVQVLADDHGNVVHLGERECSVQRRHQKVIEEAPSPAVDEATRARLGEAAVAAATTIGYVNAGTVEFVATVGDDGTLDFYFLEVNTRLQVEHPVTEVAWRAGGSPDPLDLVALQLAVAEGRRLPFGQDDLSVHNHAVEARLYAEDPATGFLPATGRLELFEPAHLPGTRWDSGVRTGDVIGPHFDPLLAKIVAGAQSRDEAIRLLAAELRHSRIHGLVTNRDALVGMLTSPRFLTGDLDTGFIEELPPDTLAPPPDRHTVALHAIAAALVGLHRRRAAARVQRTIPPGWRNNPSAPQTVRFEQIEVIYQPAGDSRWRVTVDGDDLDVHVHRLDDDAVDMTARLRVRARVTPLDSLGVVDGAPVRWAVDSPLGATTLVEQPRFPPAAVQHVPGSLTAPMPGTVASVAVAEGDRVACDDRLMVLEAMKMEHPLLAPTDGTVAAIRVRPGDQVQHGDELAVIEPDGNRNDLTD